MDTKICAVVVTHDRISLLQECINSLRKQTRKLDEIIVVNNDSKDGTKKWLDNQSDLTKIHQDNLGGAGGFHNGMKLAYEKGYDWIWLMDDDCLPDLESLFELLNFDQNNCCLLNSIVISKSNPNYINFGIEDYINSKFYTSLSDLNNYKFIYGANFFNGTLLNKKIIEKVGLPNKDFFIYGDEYEYYLRIKSASFKILTVVSSIVKHPENKHVYFGKGKLFFRFNYPSQLRVEYFPRNILTIWYLYSEVRFRRILKTYILDLYGIIFLQKKLLFVTPYLKSIISGIFFIRRINHND